MAEEARLQPLINQAYGRGIQSTDISDITEYFGGEVKRKREEYKSAQDIGQDLGAEYYGKLEGSVNSIMDEVKKGNLEVGSPEWLRQVGKLRTEASQIKQVQDLNEEYIKQLRDNPDKILYYTTDEQGNRVAGGYEDYLQDLEKMQSGQYENVSEFVNANSQLMQGMTPLKQGLTQGFENMRNEAQVFSEKLLEGSGEVVESSIRYPGTGAYISTVKTRLPEREVQRLVDTFVNEFDETLTHSYNLGKRAGFIQDQTLEEYKAETIKDMLIKEGVATDAGRYSVPRTTDTDGERLSFDSSGWSFGDYYGSFVTEDISEEGEDPFNVVSAISVENRKTNPQQDWVTSGDEGARALRGSLTRIFRDDDTGELMLKIRIGNNRRDIPFAPNYYVLEEEYGLTERDIDYLLSGRAGTEGEVLGGKSNQEDVFIEGYSNDEVRAAAEASDLTVQEYIQRYNEQQ